MVHIPAMNTGILFLAMVLMFATMMIGKNQKSKAWNVTRIVVVCVCGLLLAAAVAQPMMK